MQFDKTITIDALLQEQGRCNETFARLIGEIAALPGRERGTEAMALSAQLLELAAFELAGRMECDEVGALIRCAVSLAERSAELARDEAPPSGVLRAAMQ